MISKAGPYLFMLAIVVVFLGAIPMAIWTRNPIWLFGLFAYALVAM